MESKFYMPIAGKCEFYKNLYENISDGFCLFQIFKKSWDNLSPDFSILYFNPVFESLADFKLFSLNNSGQFEFSDIIKYEIKNNLALLIAGGSVNGYLNADAGCKQFNYHLFPLENDLFGLLFKIDNSKKSYQSPVKSEESLNSIIDSLDQIIYSLDAENRINFISHQTESIYHIPREEFIKNPFLWFEIIFDDDKNAVRENLDLSAERGFFKMDYRIRTSDGEIKWVHNQSKVLYENGKPVGIEGTVFDITDTKIIELELERKNKLMTGFFTENPLYMGVVEVRNNFTQIRHISGNRAFKKLMKKEDENDYPWTVTYENDIILEQRAALWIEKLKEVYESKKGLNFEYQFDNNGNTVYYFVTLAFLSVSEEGCPNFSFIIKNITVRKNNEIKLKEYAADLESKSKALQEEIEKNLKIQDELIEAKNSAEMANKAKSEFLANISHEIRTPMNAILGFAELIKEKEEDSKLLGYAKGIISGGNSLISLINDILDLSKIESGNIGIHIVSIDVFRLCREIFHIFDQKTKEKDLRFINYISPEVPPFLKVDEVRLRQVLINLISNAIKFTDEGYILLMVEAEQNLTDGLFEICFKIYDTGIGIPENQQKIIFEAFRQREGQNNRRFGGTGLGLTISKKLTELMKGSLNLQSIENEGSVFSVNLHEIEKAVVDDRHGLLSEVYYDVFETCSIGVKVKSHIRNILTSVFSNNSESISFFDNLNDINIEKNAYELLIIEDDCSEELLNFINLLNTAEKKIPVLLISKDRDIREKCLDIPAIASWISPSVTREQIIFELTKYINYDIKTVKQNLSIQNLPVKNINSEQIKLIKELMNSNENEFKVKFNNGITLEDCLDFADFIIGTGKKSNNIEVVEFGKVLLNLIKNYDFDKINILIKSLL